MGGQGKGSPVPVLCPFYQEREQVSAHSPELLFSLSTASQSPTFSPLQSDECLASAFLTQAQEAFAQSLSGCTFLHL